MTQSRFSTPARIALLLLGLMLVAGCQFGVLAARVLPPMPVQAKYKGLQDQTVGVFVWADTGLRISYPRFQLDLASSVINLMKTDNPKKAPKDLKGATFPVLPASMIRFTLDHPEYNGLSAEEIAPMLGVSRLIYIEIDDLTTRSELSGELYRGRCSGTVSLVEVTDGVGKVAYSESNVEAVFPPDSGADGVLGLGDVAVYNGVVAAFATEVHHRFVTWTPEE